MRYVRLLLLGGMFWIVTGCSQPTVDELRAVVEPSAGNVPYEAQVVCSRLPGVYRYELPDGRVVETTSSILDVTVDRLEWRVSVSWSDGHQARSAVAEARGTNPLPRILAPRISGDPYRWHLVPRERTLIDFTHHEGGLSGPESGVRCDGEWRLIHIRLECELKTLCGVTIGDSVFCPPYVQGVYHASWRGQVVENACIVYPLYTSETTEDGIPYAPAPELGYPYDPLHNHDVFELMSQQNAILNDVAFPAQSAVIQVVVEDEWQRRTSASFEIPVRPLVYNTPYHPWTYRARFFFADPASSVYHAAFSHSRDPYALSTCPSACGLELDSCILFCRESDAIASGRGLCPACGDILGD